MSLQVTNQIASPALKGAAVVVSLNGTETVSKLPLIQVGYKATMGSTTNVGYVSSADIYGHSFEVSPANPDQRFESIEKGYLSVNELVTIIF